MVAHAPSPGHHKKLAAGKPITTFQILPKPTDPRPIQPCAGTLHIEMTSGRCPRPIECTRTLRKRDQMSDQKQRADDSGVHRLVNPRTISETRGRGTAAILDSVADTLASSTGLDPTAFSFEYGVMFGWRIQAVLRGGRAIITTEGTHILPDAMEELVIAITHAQS